MKSRPAKWSVSVLFLLGLISVAGAVAGNRAPVHFVGVINDYTPISGGTTAWEVRGPWTLDLKGESGPADFSAAVTMEMSVVGQTTPITISALSQHTHHIIMNDATVTSFETIGDSGCPTFSTNPTTGPVLVVSGPATVTANGQTDTSFDMTGQPSQLTLCLSGGTGVPYANITLQFGVPASNHFGTQAIHGVIRKTSGSDDDHGKH
jgi:hypothetical protein